MFNYKSICTSCNTMIEEKVLDCPRCHTLGTVIPLPPELWNTAGDDSGKTTASYLPTGWLTYDSALGGGFALRAFTTLCGNPGIGKSTLSLQISQAIAQRGKSVLYFSTEEDIDRIKARAKRLKATHPNAVIRAGKTWREFLSSIPYQKPDMIILDSLSRVFDEDDKSAVGSIAQIRRCGLQLTGLAKMSDWVVLAIVHTTKSGEMAGHKGLGFDSDVNLRLILDNKTRAISLIPDKNRF
ncbi:MAG: AAA family ATPase, partial [Planctomycetota bacterium]|nr:AAA family ATPase [Planctomycetota bacterium]